MTTDLPLFTTESRLELEFQRFHLANPDVYRLLVFFAREWKLANCANRLSIKMLYERVRWECSVNGNHGHDFKLNNNHTAYYARLIMRQEHDLAHIFETREHPRV